MALEKKTIKIIAIAVATIIVVVVVLGLLLGLLLRSDNIELQVWPRAADGSAHPLISYKSSDNNSVLPWVQRIDNFLSVYQKHDLNLFECDYFNPPPENKICVVHLNEFYPCVAANQYNYRNGAPCIFLKLDKIVDWTPNPYNLTEELPQAMPEELKKEIKAVVGRPQANEVWVSCAGVETADKQFLGPVKYIPRPGLPNYYFPNKNKKGYLSPLVAVLFERPYPNKLINVECKAWAKNINSCKDCEHTAAVRFQLNVDSLM